jgi:hypothetical protein
MDIIRKKVNYKLVSDILHIIRYELPNLTDEQKEFIEDYKFQCDLEEITKVYDVYSVNDRVRKTKSNILMRFTIIPFGVALMFSWLTLPISFILYGEFKYHEIIVNFMTSWWKKIKGR